MQKEKVSMASCQLTDYALHAHPCHFLHMGTCIIAAVPSSPEQVPCFKSHNKT